MDRPGTWVGGWAPHGHSRETHHLRYEFAHISVGPVAMQSTPNHPIKLTAIRCAIENEKHLRSNRYSQQYWDGLIGVGQKKRWRMGVNMFCGVCTTYYYCLSTQRVSVICKWVRVNCGVGTTQKNGRIGCFR